MVRRAERRSSDREGGPPRTLMEIDYLLMVDDEARQGALRFAEREGGPFLAGPSPRRIPPLLDLLRPAAKLGLTPVEIDRMASAFEHEDLTAALAGKVAATVGKLRRQR